MHQQTTKAHKFAEIQKSTRQSLGNLKTFREDCTSEAMQAIFTRSKESLQKDGDLSKANEVARYGWLTTSP